MDIQQLSAIIPNTAQDAPIITYLPTLDWISLTCNGNISETSEQIDAFIDILWHPQWPCAIGIKLRNVSMLVRGYLSKKPAEEETQQIQIKNLLQIASNYWSTKQQEPPDQQTLRMRFYRIAFMIIGDSCIDTNILAQIQENQPSS